MNVTKAKLMERGELVTTPVGANEKGNLGIFSLPKAGPHDFEDPVGIVLEEGEDDAKMAVVERASLLDLLSKSEPSMEVIPAGGD